MSLLLLYIKKYMYYIYVCNSALYDLRNCASDVRKCLFIYALSFDKCRNVRRVFIAELVTTPIYTKI